MASRTWIYHIKFSTTPVDTGCVFFFTSAVSRPGTLTVRPVSVLMSVILVTSASDKNVNDNDYDDNKNRR